MNQKLSDISWQVPESEYRRDKALSYSTLAKFDREGFNKLDSLFDKVETPSLSFGSAVDALITGGQEEFDKNFIVADFPKISDTVLKIVKELFNRYSHQFTSISTIPTQNIIDLTEELKYQLNWKPETRAKVIKEQGQEYYSILYIAQGKQVLSVQTKEEVDAAVRALKESEGTKFYFQDNNIFDDSVQRYYQLKFKATFNDIEYRCMSDLLVVDYENKLITPVDLKTSSHAEWDFYESFIQWSYSIQARLYWRIIRDNLDRDPYWKEFKLADYRFIVVNRKTLTPLVWEYPDTKEIGTLYYGKNKQIECKDPFDLGKLLSNYLTTRSAVPQGIATFTPNNLKDWLNSL